MAPTVPITGPDMAITVRATTALITTAIMGRDTTAAVTSNAFAGDAPGRCTEVFYRGVVLLTVDSVSSFEKKAGLHSFTGPSFASVCADPVSIGQVAGLDSSSY